jgi:hypothetical protein
MELRAAAPDAWQRFTDAVQMYAAEIGTNLVSAPVESLPRAQGMALQARDIAVMLATAPKIYEKMQAARTGKRNV